MKSIGDPPVMDCNIRMGNNASSLRVHLVIFFPSMTTKFNLSFQSQYSKDNISSFLVNK